MKTKIPALSFLFFITLLTFLIVYSYKKLLIIEYRKTLTTEDASQVDVRHAIQGMTNVGNPAVPALRSLLESEKDPARQELILGALLRIRGSDALGIVETFFQKNPPVDEWPVLNDANEFELSSSLVRTHSQDQLAMANALFARRPAEALERLLALLTDEKLHIRQEAQDLLIEATDALVTDYHPGEPSEAGVLAWRERVARYLRTIR